MPWKETCTMTERMKFVVLAQEDGASMSELCRQFGISRKTGYKRLERYEAEGMDGLQDRSHAPLHHPYAVSDDVERRILSLRAEHPSWGPRKLKARLQMIDPPTQWPVASTIGELLHRHGLTVPRRRRVVTPADISPFANCAGPNDTWCIDFKGWFRTRDGRRCDPLTISDAHSRYLLRCQAVRRADTRCVRPLLEASFREYGLPLSIRSDNGPPFASRGVAGLSQLSVWFIKLGLKPERITPGRPCENGRHERMHGTMQREACQPPEANRRAQQRRFDDFRRVYNEERPHEAIANATPAMIYRPSPRPYPARLPEMVYPDHWQVRKVHQSGEIRWRGQSIFISEVLTGEPVALDERAEGLWQLYFGPLHLGTLDHRCKFERAGERRRGRVALRSMAAPRAAPTN
jgi:putative transposase